MPFVEADDKKDKNQDKKFIKNCYFGKFVCIKILYKFDACPLWEHRFAWFT